MSKTKTQRKTKALGIRLTPDQKKLIDFRAKILDMTTTDYLTWLVERDAKRVDLATFLKLTFKSIFNKEVK